MEIFKKVVKILEELSGSDEIRAESLLAEELALDSLRMVMLLIELEEEFGIELDVSDLDPSVLKTASDVAKMVETYFTEEGEADHE